MNPKNDIAEIISFLKKELMKKEVKEIFVNMEGNIFVKNDIGEFLQVNKWELSETEKMSCLNYLTNNSKFEDCIKYILPDGNILFGVLNGNISSNVCFTIIKPAIEKDNLYNALSIKQKEYLKKYLQENKPILVVGTNENLNIKFINTLLKVQSDIDKKLAEAKVLDRILVINEIGELFYKNNSNSLILNSLNSTKTDIMNNTIALFKPEKTFISKVAGDEDIINYFNHLISADIIHTSIKINDFEILNLKYPTFYKEIEREEILVIKVDGKPENGKPIDFEFYFYKNNKKEKIEFTNQ
jgi:hypothetical protein